MSNKIITFKHKGDFLTTINFLKRVREEDYTAILQKYGRIGVAALEAATPKRTGKTAASWHYRIEKNGWHNVSLIWYNTNVNKGVNIALLIQYGHGTRQGAYVQGIDYINPAIKPIFDDIANESWKEVSNL